MFKILVGEPRPSVQFEKRQVQIGFPDGASAIRRITQDVPVASHPTESAQWPAENLGALLEKIYSPSRFIPS